MIRDTRVAESRGLQEQLQGAASILPDSSRGSEAGESQWSTLAALHQAARPLLQAAIGIWQHCKPLKYLTADLKTNQLTCGRRCPQEGQTPVSTGSSASAQCSSTMRSC